MVYKQDECKTTPYQEKMIEKNEKTKEEKIKENLMKANDHCNY